MGFGISKIFRFCNIQTNSIKFYLRKLLLGFEHANLMTRYIDKESLVKILKSNGADIGKGCDIESGLTFHNCLDYSNFIVGDNAHIGKNCFIDLAGKVVIGKNSVISMNSSFLTHINMHRSSLEDIYPSSVSGISIGEDVYIGAGCMLLMGAEIGNGSLVAAGSTVTKKFGPCSFLAGTPAVLKKTIQR